MVRLLPRRSCHRDTELAQGDPRSSNVWSVWKISSRAMWSSHYPVIMNFMKSACTPRNPLPRGPFSTFLFISSMSSISSRVILPTSVLLAYHIPCVSTRINNSTPWLTTRRRLCPICKRDIIAPSPLSTPTPTSELSPLLQNADHQGPSQDWRGDTAGQSAV